MKRVTGRFRITRHGDEEVHAHIPNPLPPRMDEEVLREISGKERYQAYCYRRYLDILNEGIEPPARGA